MKQKVIICGAGRVGASITEHLSNEGFDITVIDSNSEAIQRITELYDVQGVVGLASYPNQTRPRWLQTHSKNYTIELLKKAFSYSDCKNVVLSGGYSLNCVNNYHYVKEFPDYNFFVDPVAHDGGTAIGAALWVNEKK